MCVCIWALQINWHIFTLTDYIIFAIITTFSPNLVIKLVFSGMSPQILAIGTFLGPVILSDEVYIPEVWKYIKLVHPLQLLIFFGHITSANIDSQLYKLRDSVARMQSDLCSDEDMSFMAYSELQFFSFYHRNKPHEKHPQLEIKCMSVTVEGNSFLDATAFPYLGPHSRICLNPRKLNCIHQNGLFYASSVSSLSIKAAELLTSTAGWSSPYTN